jgi:hypothetical protein
MGSFYWTAGERPRPRTPSAAGILRPKPTVVAFKAHPDDEVILTGAHSRGRRRPGIAWSSSRRPTGGLTTKKTIPESTNAFDHKDFRVHRGE